MITKDQLHLKFAERLNDPHFLDERSSWIGEVQVKDGFIIFRVDDDYQNNSVWYMLELTKIESKSKLTALL